VDVDRFGACESVEKIDRVTAADVFVLAGKTDQAGTALGQALPRYERKGNIVIAERTCLRLEDVEATAPS
jgi:hypothetical protein